MRSTGGGDAAYDIDFPARDHILVEQLRNKGAIIFAKAVNTEYNGRAGDPSGRHTTDKALPSVLGYQRGTWGGNPSNVYDTSRAASLSPNAGLTEMLGPAGYVTTAYDPVFKLSEDATRYVPAPSECGDDSDGAWPSLLLGVPGRPRTGGCAAPHRLVL